MISVTSEVMTREERVGTKCTFHCGFTEFQSVHKAESLKLFWLPEVRAAG